MQLPSFAYRAGQSILINNAAIRIARRPDPLATKLLKHVLDIADPRPNALGANTVWTMAACRLLLGHIHIHVTAAHAMHCAGHWLISPSVDRGKKLDGTGGKITFHFVSEASASC